MDFLTPFEVVQPVKETRKVDTAVVANQALVEPLTKREIDVLQLIANGLTNRQITDKLFISAGNVKYYSSHIYSKLQVANRTQAVAVARELGLLS